MRRVYRMARPACLVALLLGALLLGVVFAPSPVALAELDEDAWKAVTKGLSRLQRNPGAQEEKLDRIRTLTADDQVRTAELLVGWGIESDKLRRGKLVRAFETAEKKRDAYRKTLIRKHGEELLGSSPKERAKLNRLEATLDEARYYWDTERQVDHALAAALGALEPAAVWHWVFTSGVPALRDAGYQGRLYRAVFRGIGKHPGIEARAAGLLLIGGETPAAVRIQAIDWAADQKIADAYAPLHSALDADAVPIRRAAVRGLYALDDARCVPGLIAALAKADGLLATEIDSVLHHFTGLSLEADASAWRRWWADKGEAWKASGRHGRKRRALQAADAAFYGIRSPSKRIIFVLDHSGSMNKPLNGLHAVTGEPRPGGSRMEAARTELKRAISALADDVRFNVIFYAESVTVWRRPRKLLPASTENKKSVLAWIDRMEAEGPTSLFDALDKVLAYTDGFKGDEGYAHPGVDTVFLLTDGSPTDDSGNDLKPRQIESALLAFSQANRIHRIVVHTVGIGRGHNRRLMERIAKSTDGSYVRVVPK